MQTPKQTLILGVGNILMGDEGVGVHAIAALQRNPLPAGVRVLDGGTGGFHLLALFAEYDPIILIDATMDGHPAGTVRVTHPRFASDFPSTLSAHDIGLRDLLESAALLGPLPNLHLVAISVEAVQPMTMDLSTPVRESLPRACVAVHDLLGSRT